MKPTKEQIEAEAQKQYPDGFASELKRLAFTKGANFVISQPNELREEVKG